MTRAQKLFVIAAILAVVVPIAGVAAYLRWHTLLLEKEDVVGLHVAEMRQSNLTLVRLSGLSGAAYCVKEIDTTTEGSSIVVLVNVCLLCRGKSGSFNHDVPIPPWIDEVRFGGKREVVWKRELARGGSLR